MPDKSQTNESAAERDAGITDLKAEAAVRDSVLQHRQALESIRNKLANTFHGPERDILLQGMLESINALTKVVESLSNAVPLRGKRKAAAPSPLPETTFLQAPVVFLVDSDTPVRAVVRIALENSGCIVRDYGRGEDFLREYRAAYEACLLIDAYLPDINGLDVLRRLRDAGDQIPVVFITGLSDVPTAVEAMRRGASDFLEKPIGHVELLACIGRALERSQGQRRAASEKNAAEASIAGLRPRERQILDLVLAGHPNKQIAAELGLNQRTVESHRAALMKRTGVKSIPELARLAVSAAKDGAESLR